MASIAEQGPVMDKANAQLKSQASSKDTSNLLSLMLLDILGFVLILLGLTIQYNNFDALPVFLSFPHIGLVILAMGTLMTLPFLAWAFRSCESALKNISSK